MVLNQAVKVDDVKKYYNCIMDLKSNG